MDVNVWIKGDGGLSFGGRVEVDLVILYFLMGVAVVLIVVGYCVWWARQRR